MSRKRMMIAIGNETQMSTVDLITLRTVLSDADRQRLQGNYPSDSAE